MVFRWPIEIDGLPFLKMVIFHGKLLNNQMVTGCFFWLWSAILSSWNLGIGFHKPGDSKSPSKLLMPWKFTRFLSLVILVRQLRGPWNHDPPRCGVGDGSSIFINIFSGWWFGTFFLFPYVGNNHPNGRTPSFFRGVGWNHQPVINKFSMAYGWLPVTDMGWPWGVPSTSSKKINGSNGALKLEGLEATNMWQHVYQLWKKWLMTCWYTSPYIDDI